jgi:Protein of unknown function (DUF1615)
MRHVLRIGMLSIAALAAACAHEPSGQRSSAATQADGRALIDRSLPPGITHRDGWVGDLYAAFVRLDIAPTHENICAVVAVTEQESGFQVDPVIPNLGPIAWQEIDKRAARAAIPPSLVREVLSLRSSTGQSYAERIDHAKTEKQLSDIFEDFTGSIPLGRALFASWNPIRTRGPMQVNVAFAKAFADSHPYPYPVQVSIADEVFTRRGSLYFGVAHLLAYPAPYDRYLYRFADYNAGQYASRNAAFQAAVSAASGFPLDPDGALLQHEGGAAPGSTELAVRSLGQRVGLDEAAIHAALEQERSESFERAALYRKVFDLAERARGRPLPRALLPHIRLEGPKIRRNLTTEWYARRVEERFNRCLAR